MAYYTYKIVRDMLPEDHVEKFKARYKRDYDYDGNYDGDQWISAADYIADLQAEIKQLKGEK